MPIGDQLLVAKPGGLLRVGCVAPVGAIGALPCGDEQPVEGAKPHRVGLEPVPARQPEREDERGVGLFQPELAQVVRIIMHNVEFTEEETELQRFLKIRKEGVYSAMEKAFRVLRRHNAIKVAGSPELLANCLLSYLHGLIHNYLSPEERKVDLRKHGDIALDYLLDSLLVEDT